MVGKHLVTVVFSFSLLCCSCLRYRVMKVGDETVLKNPKYRLTYILDEKGTQIIDTSSIYVYQGDYLKFFTNGVVVRGNKYFSPYSGNKNFQTHPNSVKRGRYELMDNNRIKLELFYPSQPAPFANGYLRVVRKGEVFEDTIKITSSYGHIRNYIREDIK